MTEEDKRYVWVQCSVCSRILPILYNNYLFSPSRTYGCSNGCGTVKHSLIKPTIEQVGEHYGKIHEGSSDHRPEIRCNWDNEDLTIKIWSNINQWNGWAYQYRYNTDPTTGIFFGEIEHFPRPNPSPDAPNLDYLGSDYHTLKPQQQTDRQKTRTNYKKSCQEQNYRRSLICPYCQQTFDYDKKIDEYLLAHNEVKARLDAHKLTCQLKNNQSEKKRIYQEKWDEIRKNGEIDKFYVCEKKGCWGKVYFDKNIANAKKASDQAWADLGYHQKHECGNQLVNPQIAIYFSPSQGGHQHANLSYMSEVYENDLILEIVNEGSHSHEQDKNKINWVMWILGGLGITLFLVGIIWLTSRKRPQKS